MVTVERVTEGAELGEGPHWDISTQSLYFVDILKKQILKYTPATKKLTAATTEKQPSFIIPVEGRKNEFVLSQDNEIVIISWDGESDKVSVIKKLDAVPDVAKKFNDGKCDSSGRLWAGAHILAEDFRKTQPVGSLYSLESKLKPHVDKIACSNGLAFNDKTKKFFYIDSLKEAVDRFDFDISSGTISNREVWFSFKKFNIPGIPDGMTIDSEGNLWVAACLASRVLKVSGDQKETLLSAIELPAEQVTSAAFGGANLDELYVTTGAMEFQGKKLFPPEHGATYRIKGTGAKGLPAANFKLN